MRTLAVKSTPGPWAHWRSDSRALLYGVQSFPWQGDSVRKVVIHEVTLDGQDRALHSLTMRCGPGGAYCGKIIDDSLLSTWYNGAYSLTNFRAQGTPRVVYTRDGYQTPQAPPVAASRTTGAGWRSATSRRANKAGRSS